jgi:hypothetical protein
MDNLKDKLIDKNIIEALGLENMSAEDKIKFIANFSETVIQIVMIRVAGSLPQEDREEFKTILESGDESKLGRFLFAKFPNIESMVTEEALKLKQAMVERTKKIDEMLASKNNKSQLTNDK